MSAEQISEMQAKLDNINKIVNMSFEAKAAELVSHDLYNYAISNTLPVHDRNRNADSTNTVVVESSEFLFPRAPKYLDIRVVAIYSYDIGMKLDNRYNTIDAIKYNLIDKILTNHGIVLTNNMSRLYFRNDCSFCKYIGHNTIDGNICYPCYVKAMSMQTKLPKYMYQMLTGFYNNAHEKQEFAKHSVKTRSSNDYLFTKHILQIFYENSAVVDPHYAMEQMMLNITERESSLSIRETSYDENISLFERVRSDTLKKKKDLDEREKVIADRETVLEASLKKLDACTTSLDAKEKAITEREKKITECEKAITEREKAFTEHEKAITEHEKAITEREKAIAEREKVIADREKAITERENANATNATTTVAPEVIST